MKHTPGPWHRNSDGWDWIDGKDTEPICHFPEDQVLEEHLKANMNLICAAPKLLDIARIILTLQLSSSHPDVNVFKFREYVENTIKEIEGG